MPMPLSEILAMARRGETILVMCRSAAEPLAPGAIRHYHCAACNAEVQVSPPGRQQIIAGATPLCNRCGMQVIESRANNQAPTTIALGPYAEDYLQRRANSGDQDAREILKHAREEDNTDA